MLTADQIQAIRARAGIKPIESPNSAVSELDSAWGNTSAQPTQEDSSIKNFSKGLAKGEVSTLKGLSDLGLKAADQTVGRVINAVKGNGFVPTNTAENGFTAAVGGEDNANNLTKPEGTAEKIGFGAEKIAEFAIPGSKVAEASKGAGLLTKALVEGATGATVSAAQQGDVNKEALTTGVVSAALPGIGAGLNKAGSALAEYLPQRLIRSAIGQSKNELLAGKDVSDYILKKGKFGTAAKLLDDSQTSIKSLSDTIGSNLQSTVKDGVRVDGKAVVTNVADTINNSGGEISPEEVYNVVTTLAPQTKGLLKKFFDEGLDLVQSNKLRQALDQTLGDNAFLAGQLPYNKTILRMFDNGLRNTVKDLAPEGTKQAFSDLSKEITLRDALADRITSQSRNQVVNGFDLLFGGLGSLFGGGIPGAVSSVAIKKALQSTVAKTGTAQILDSALLKSAGALMNKLAPEEKAVIQTLISAFSNENKSTK